MKNLKEGDRVILASSFYGDTRSNPVWLGKHGRVKGTVIFRREGGHYTRVHWDNGTTNSYQRGLEYVGHDPSYFNNPNVAFKNKRGT